MKHIAILVLNKMRLNSADIPHQAFSEVNQILASQGKPALFDVQLVGLKKQVSLNDGLYTVSPDAVIKDLKKTDLIIIPAMDGNLQNALSENLDFIPWIINQYKNGAEVASLCVGAFLLASTGLLKGKQCSTHWRAANAFSAIFPEVNLVINKIITDDNGIYSSGGSFSSANLVLYLIEKYAGRDVAIQCAKLFEVDIERSSQSPFMIFSGQKNHKDNLILEVQNYLENNYNNKITINELADKFNTGRRTFERRFKRATSNTIVEYIQRIKIEAAKYSLEKGRKTVSEVMYEVGYSDTKAFREVFKKFTGVSPIDYKSKYSKRIASN